jgi:MtN3 and saliva related transmembrane protein
MFLVFSVGILLWLIYGLMVRDAPLTAANAVTLVLAVTILGLKLRHG